MSISAEHISDLHSYPVHAAGDRVDNCPWCNQPIPAKKLAEISGRMAAREHELLAEAAGRLREQFAREATQREAAIRAEVLQAAQAGAETKLAEAESARQRAEAAKLAAEQQTLALKASYENEVSRRVHEAREALEKDRTAAVHAEQARTFEERQKLQGKVQELQKQLENRTAQELGEGADINLFETLRATFYSDRINRVAKNTAGADLIHEVVHNGKVCGKIVYDSKNRSLWRSEYVLKLREDQIAAQADHAILSSNKFPAGTRQLHMQDGVIVACPARILALAELFRSHIVQLHELRISNEAREEKTAALYAFITSERCSQLLDQVDSLIEKLLEIDISEHKAHQAVWEKRGRMLKSVLKAHGDFSVEIDRIVGRAELKYPSEF